jgi:mitosis inhibitor protein kinase SWE1
VTTNYIDDIVTDWPVPHERPPTANLPPPSSSRPSPRGRFERDFAEVDELGSGEFGRVIKAKWKRGGSEEMFAIKKSKRYEGTRHR